MLKIKRGMIRYLRWLGKIYRKSWVLKLKARRALWGGRVLDETLPPHKVSWNVSGKSVVRIWFLR